MPGPLPEAVEGTGVISLGSMAPRAKCKLCGHTWPPAPLSGIRVSLPHACPLLPLSLRVAPLLSRMLFSLIYQLAPGGPSACALWSLDTHIPGTVRSGKQPLWVTQDKGWDGTRLWEMQL